MSLVERLGYKTLKHLYSELDNNDIIEWAAYDMLKDPDTLKRFQSEINIEKQRNQSIEEEGAKIEQLFRSLGHNI